MVDIILANKDSFNLNKYYSSYILKKQAEEKKKRIEENNILESENPTYTRSNTRNIIQITNKNKKKENNNEESSKIILDSEIDKILSKSKNVIKIN